MDILQHTLGQITFIILIQLLYLEISTVQCFAWHSPSQARSQTVPAETHIISQRWHQSVPKWYPYNMWKRRKRKESEIRDFMDISGANRGSALNGNLGDVVSKYHKLLDKMSRKKIMNSILRKDQWKHEGKSTVFGASFYPPENAPAASTAKVLEESDYLSRKHKSHFGSISSVEEDFIKPVEESVSEEKKTKDTGDSGFGDDGFGKSLTSGFGTDGGFKQSKTDDAFSSDFLSTDPKIPNEADTAAKTSTGFGNDPFASDGGSWGDSSWSDSGSWGGDGFGAVDESDSSSWGDSPVGTGSFSSTGGAFSQDTKDCDTILTKSCADNSECSCYGFYTCSNQRCQSIQSTGTSSASAGGGWHEQPVSFGFSKRKDPRKVIQIFMLPWQPQK